MKKAWLVVEGSKHGLRVSDAMIDVIRADTAEAAAAEYEKSHDGQLERLFVFPYDHRSFDVETVIRPVPPA